MVWISFLLPVGRHEADLGDGPQGIKYSNGILGANDMISSVAPKRSPPLGLVPWPCCRQALGAKNFHQSRLRSREVLELRRIY